MKSHKSIGTILMISALLFSMGTCYGQDDSSDHIVGKWTKLSQQGTITFTFTSDKKYEVEFTGDGEADVLGSYVISGTKLTVTDEGGDYSSGTSGVYEFKVDDTSLTLTKVDDPVDGRSMIAIGTWSRAKE